MPMLRIAEGGTAERPCDNARRSQGDAAARSSQDFVYTGVLHWGCMGIMEKMETTGIGLPSIASSKRGNRGLHEVSLSTKRSRSFEFGFLKALHFTGVKRINFLGFRLGQ